MAGLEEWPTPIVDWVEFSEDYPGELPQINGAAGIDIDGSRSSTIDEFEFARQSHRAVIRAGESWPNRNHHI